MDNGMCPERFCEQFVERLDIGVLMDPANGIRDSSVDRRRSLVASVTPRYHSCQHPATVDEAHQGSAAVTLCDRVTTVSHKSDYKIRYTPSETPCLASDTPCLTSFALIRREYHSFYTVQEITNQFN